MVIFSNISNNFHDFPNYDSGSRDSPKIMEILGFTNIFASQSYFPRFLIISMIFRTMALAHEISRKSWKLLALPIFIFRESIMEHIDFHQDFQEFL